MLTRRSFLGLAGAGLLVPAAASAYGIGIEPGRLVTTGYQVELDGFPVDAPPLRLAVIADIHACDPWMPLAQIERIVDAANALQPDLTLLLGDYVAAIRHFGTRPVAISEWSRVLGRLKAPLGVHAVLGNHDWWTDPDGVKAGLADNGIHWMENEAVLIRPGGAPPFWLAGLGDQYAIPAGRLGRLGVDDLPKTLKAMAGHPAPAILMAHEPDIFPQVPDRVGLTICGHTHGGQVALPIIGRPVVPSRYGQRYAYGHVEEEGRQIVVSGGLGCTGLPIRFGVPPEIVTIAVSGRRRAQVSRPGSGTALA